MHYHLPLISLYDRYSSYMSHHAKSKKSAHLTPIHSAPQNILNLIFLVYIILRSYNLNDITTYIYGAGNRGHFHKWYSSKYAWLQNVDLFCNTPYKLQHWNIGSNTNGWPVKSSLHLGISHKFSPCILTTISIHQLDIWKMCGNQRH